jgi:hypothetical protein
LYYARSIGTIKAIDAKGPPFLDWGDTMNKNKTLALSVALTAIVAFSAGFVTAADHRDGRFSRGLVQALESVGINLFGDGNFGVSIVGATPPDDNMPDERLVQIDVDGATPPDDSLPVVLNLFGSTPPDDNLNGCAVVAQIAVTADGVSVYADAKGQGRGTIMVLPEPLGVTPKPCQEVGVVPPDDGIVGDGPGRGKAKAL